MQIHGFVLWLHGWCSSLGESCSRFWSPAISDTVRLCKKAIFARLVTVIKLDISTFPCYHVGKKKNKFCLLCDGDHIQHAEADQNVREGSHVKLFVDVQESHRNERQHQKVGRKLDVVEWSCEVFSPAVSGENRQKKKNQIKTQRKWKRRVGTFFLVQLKSPHTSLRTLLLSKRSTQTLWGVIMPQHGRSPQNRLANLSLALPTSNIASTLGPPSWQRSPESERPSIPCIHPHSVLSPKPFSSCCSSLPYCPSSAVFSSIYCEAFQFLACHPLLSLVLLKVHSNTL